MKSRQLIEVESGFWTPTRERPFSAPTTPTRKPNRHQDIMNRAHDRWQTGGDLENKSREDFYAALPEPDRMVTMLGHLNYQVGNGGFSQWIGNGYGDASIGHLIDYCEKYGTEYPALAKVGDMLKSIVDDAEDTETRGRRGEGQLQRWLDGGPSEDDLTGAITDQDWDEVDRILGGTDLDARRFRRECGEVINSADTTVYAVDGVNTDEEIVHAELTARLSDDPWAEAPPSGPARWSWKLKLGSTEIYDDYARTGKTYHTEDEAEAAADNRRLNLDDLDDETPVVDQATNDLIKEYSQHLSDQGPSAMLDALDERYYVMNDAVLADIGKLLDEKFPEAAASRAKTAMKKFWGTVRKGAARAVSAVTGIPGGARDLGNRFKRAGTAAAKAFRASESVVKKREKRGPGQDDPDEAEEKHSQLDNPDYETDCKTGVDVVERRTRQVIDDVLEEEEIDRMKVDIEDVGNKDPGEICQ